jgi:uncharacterized protein YkwD
MCERNFFAHENPDGESPFDRMADQGLTFVAAAENIYMATLGDPQDLIADAEEAFMDEPECAANHRGNILNRDYKYVGVGLYECPDGWFYVTRISPPSTPAICARMRTNTASKQRPIKSFYFTARRFP